ncbi:MAG: TIGR03668 family PPOX class F420-dependent oxidoreductase [Mycobacterium sp.]
MTETAELVSRFAAAPVARLATVTTDGAPHLVPVVFAVHNHTVFTAVDGKPKSTQRLKRLANIAANPRVSLLVDHYADDWTTLWWIRADGRAEVTGSETGRDLLRAKYPQYQTVSLDGPVIAINIEHWSSWGLG